MKIAVIIPSRFGSSRFEGKPLALILGKPMIQRVYEAALGAKNVTDVVVATDDQRIAEAVSGFGGRAVMTSGENRSGTDRVAEAAARMALAMDDIVINVQGDQPLLDPRCLKHVTAPFFSDGEAGMTTLAYKIVDPREITNPKDVKVTFDVRGYALYFSRSPIPFGRDAGIPFDTYKHLGVYAYTRGFLEMFRKLPEGRLEAIEKLEQLRALEYGHKIRIVVTPYDSPEVDLPEDIPRIEALMG
ncbi:3-deoxy-manno-octulosonate cytidylyltransferase [Desulfococcus multivorans]|uniref:3-deoxy-manno-octulosonate cytidylyltransferase n=1 Tax=Desulfococcus multivorans DSM 2059 TaxID=1121405 RepID=S7U0T5_DESML|nr:3-deoxy-manno-octulosonate cytidylyltransferase [Desulfococcus multivorans]AOY58823.1 KdsB: 3-deoxy-manno-octulosonate cytidylyltransferase [Desulfococcus multivorans]AQV01109.1 3-deoxy-manno-octulosonate cytidylyltransferase [Desulfococcus multivorans]EPR42947.1 3-deoxy-manno-octulosonate cytidylyltransferase [Desulfococcus multivorans DSM 2059]SJZ51058.1 3-deoxy-manno-octulosonate cytidylyltransferase (CMP-KDO synthetase) [Desulfococcus multivorans DSM 2059]